MTEPTTAQVAAYVAITEDLALVGKFDIDGDDYDDDGELVEEERPEVRTLEEAMLISSQVVDIEGSLTGEHKIILDVDMPVVAVPSSQEGHWHIVIDKKLPEAAYLKLLGALVDAGVVERGYLDMTTKREAAHLRVPWVLKDHIIATKAAKDRAQQWKTLIEEPAK